MYVSSFSKGFRVVPRVFKKAEAAPAIFINRLLLETGDFILLETNDRILLE